MDLPSSESEGESEKETEREEKVITFDGPSEK